MEPRSVESRRSIIKSSTVSCAGGGVNIRGVIQELEQTLREGGIASARAEAEWLIAGRLGVSRTELYLREEPLRAQDVEILEGWVDRRLAGEPLQYVVGHTQFVGHRLEVSRDVLVPRPETEGLVDEASRYLETLTRRGISPWVLDLGTGSGNIALSLSLAIPSCLVVAVELSWNALRAAQANLHRHRLQDRVYLVQAEWTQGLLRRPRFDLVISNPPYVPTNHVHGLPREVGYEPRLSLDGGHDDRAEFPSKGQQVAIQAAPLHLPEISGPAAPMHRRNSLFL